MQLNWTDLALADLDIIEAYIAEDNSPVVALDVVLNVLDTTEQILSAHPNAGRMGRVKDTRELVIDGISFTVIYRVMGRLSQVQILRVLHDAQNWPPNKK